MRVKYSVKKPISKMMIMVNKINKTIEYAFNRIGKNLKEYLLKYGRDRMVWITQIGNRKYAKVAKSNLTPFIKEIK